MPSTVIPALRYADAPAAIRFLVDAFGFTAHMVVEGDAGIIETFERGTRAGEPVVDGIPMLIVWALALVVFGHVLLTKTRFWDFSSYRRMA